MTDDTTKLYIKEQTDKERDVSDKSYAIKLVEKIVFGMVGLICVAFIGSLIALVMKT